MLFNKKKDRMIRASIEITEPAELSVRQANPPFRLAWKITLLTAWAPISAGFFLLFQNGLNHGMFIITGEEQGRLLSTYTILLGFYITVRYVFFQLRDSKSLTGYRSTVYWMLAEYSSYVGWLLIFTAAVIGVFDYILAEPNALMYAMELALFFTALIYALIDFICASKAYRYI